MQSWDYENNTLYHISAMQNEVLFYLNCMPGKIYVDCTVGGSGHAKAILKSIIPDGLLIAIDQDIDAIENARIELKEYKENTKLVHDNFVNLEGILSELDIKGVDGILLDLGLSLHQIRSAKRGFSFRSEEILDMRMDIRSEITAKTLINTMTQDNLTKIFREYGEERFAKKIAKNIVEKRMIKPVVSAKELAEIVADSIPKGNLHQKRIHPATKIFMALRIAVNKELEILEAFMSNVSALLNPGGRLCVLSFHSLEDRIVKHQMKAMEKGCVCPTDLPKCICNQKPKLKNLTRHVVIPAEAEISKNPMARSTRLRAAEKI